MSDKNTLPIHQDYLNDIPDWNEIDIFLRGKHKELYPYLVQMEVEKQGTVEASLAYQRRKEVLEYFNQTKLIRSMHLAALSQDISSEELEGDRWKLLLEDITGFDIDFTTFVRWLIEKFLAHGKVGAFVDSPSIVSESVAESEGKSERSYLVGKEAKDILYWERFHSGQRKGQFKDVIFVDTTRVVEDEVVTILLRLQIEASDTARFTFQRYAVKSDDTKALSGTVDGELIQEGEGGVTFIPFVIIGRGLDDSALNEVQKLSKNRMNKKSALDNINYHQGFQRTFMWGVEQSEAQILAENTIAHSTNPDGRIDTIQPGDPKSLEADYKALDRTIFRVGLMQKHMLAEDTRDSQSAESKSKDADALNEFYDRVLDLFTDKVSRLMGYMAQFEGLGDTVNVSFTRNYRSDQTEQQLAQAQLAFLQAGQLNVPSVQGEILKTSVSRMNIQSGEEGKEEEVKKQLADDIDDAVKKLQEQPEEQPPEPVTEQQDENTNLVLGA